jgi:uncharacterized protein (DUF427 family)
VDRPPLADMVPPPRVAPTPRWVRVRAGDLTVADSRRALLLAWYGPGRLPTYLFPADDVRTELLAPSEAPVAGGDGVPHDLRAGDRVLPDVARLFREPPEGLEAARDHWTFTWDGRVTWLEEAFEVGVHARDPSKRVDVVPSERRVQVRLDGVTVADSRRPHALFEDPLPPRWYLPPEDVDLALLQPSDTVSRCPYKGTARYWSARVGDALHRDVAWSYPDPIPECPRVKGLIAFFNEHVDLVIDGELQPRPVTPWSGGAAAP